MVIVPDCGPMGNYFSSLILKIFHSAMAFFKFINDEILSLCSYQSDIAEHQTLHL